MPNDTNDKAARAQKEYDRALAARDAAISAFDELKARPHTAREYGKAWTEVMDAERDLQKAITDPYLR